VKFLVLALSDTLELYNYLFGEENCIVHQVDFQPFDKNAERERLSDTLRAHNDIAFLGGERLGDMAINLGLTRPNWYYDLDLQRFLNVFGLGRLPFPFIHVDSYDYFNTLFNTGTFRERDLVLKGQCQHGHFSDKGLTRRKKVLWYPYWLGWKRTLTTLVQDWTNVFQPTEKYSVCFHGTSATWKPRKKLVELVNEAFDDVCAEVVSRCDGGNRVAPADYVKLILSSDVCLNMRGNGVLTIRFFEILRHGQFCLTDRCLLDGCYWPVSPRGSERFGRCCGEYEDIGTVVAECRYWLEHPDERAEVARNGAEFWRCLYSPDALRVYGRKFLEGYCSGELEFVLAQYLSEVGGANPVEMV